MPSNDDKTSQTTDEKKDVKTTAKQEPETVTPKPDERDEEIAHLREQLAAATLPPPAPEPDQPPIKVAVMHPTNPGQPPDDLPRRDHDQGPVTGHLLGVDQDGVVSWGGD